MQVGMGEEQLLPVELDPARHADIGPRTRFRPRPRPALRVRLESSVGGTVSCNEAGEAADVGDECPGGRAFDGALEVLGEAAAAAEPGEGALDHPTPRQDDEALGGRGTLDDLERPSAQPCQRRRQLVAGVAAIGEQVAQPGKRWRIALTRSTAPSRSWMSAACTSTKSIRPSVSVTMWRLRPLSFLPAS